MTQKPAKFAKTKKSPQVLKKPFKKVSKSKELEEVEKVGDVKKETVKGKGVSGDEGMFEAISRVAKDAIAVMDSKARLTFWNKAAEDMFGWKQKEILGKELHKVITTELDEGTYHKDIHQFSQTGKTWVVGGTFQLPVKRKDGSTFTIELSVSSVQIGGEWFAVGIMRDISQRKAEEEKMAERQEELEKMNKLMVGRELKMVELKEEIASLKKEIASLKEMEMGGSE